MNKLGKFFSVTSSVVLAVSLASPASAADIFFSFDDGPTTDFYGRTHVPGTVTGKLLGLVDNATSAPTAIQILSSPDIIGLVEGTYGGDYQDGGFTLVGGVVTTANFAFNFRDANANSFQMRFNCVGGAFTCNGGQADLNLLFWNGGSTPVNGTGNQAGFAGVTYGANLGAVPEPATWAMMLVGFGAMGAVVRRHRQVVRVTYA